MTIFYSASAKGFFDSTIHTEIPKDKVEISYEYWQELLTAQSNGQKIVANDSGYPIAEDYPAPTKDETISLYSKFASKMIDETAQSWGYDNIVSATSYVTSTNQQYKADAETLIPWRDSVWEKAYQIFAVNPLPANVESFLAMLPAVPTKPTSN